MTEQTVKQIISKVLKTKIDNVGNQHQLILDLGADSLDVVEILMLIDKEFDISIEEHDIEEAGYTVADLITLVNKKIQSK
jgi:acyl carrier protein